jgi:HTH-type transcriptional regulator/antitoxin HigA
MMNVKPLRNERDYDWAIGEVARYFEAEPAPGSADGDRFEVLSTLIKAHEDKHFGTPHGDPVEFSTLRSSRWANRRPNGQP